jgi:hypothetical protein
MIEVTSQGPDSDKDVYLKVEVRRLDDQNHGTIFEAEGYLARTELLSLINKLREVLRKTFD